MEEKKICPACGAELPAEARHCTECGAKLEGAEAAAKAAEAVVQASEDASVQAEDAAAKAEAAAAEASAVFAAPSFAQPSPAQLGVTAKFNKHHELDFYLLGDHYKDKEIDTNREGSASWNENGLVLKSIEWRTGNLISAGVGYTWSF